MAYVYRTQSHIWTPSQEYDPSNWAVIDYPDGGSYYSQITRYFNTKDFWRDYHGIELETSTRVNSYFSYSLSYTYSQVRGNSEAGDGMGQTVGIFEAGTAAGLYHYKSYMDSAGIPASERSPSGALSNDFPHKLRATAQLVLPMGNQGWISFAGIFSYDSGSNWNATGYTGLGMENIILIYDTHVALQAADPTLPTPFVPSRTRMIYYGPRGAFHQNDQHSVDAQISWEVPAWKGVRTMGYITINNVFNMQYQVRYNTQRQFDGSEGSTGYFVGSFFGSNMMDSAGRILRMGSVAPRSVSASIGLKF
jgi:hypothetical protein